MVVVVVQTRNDALLHFDEMLSLTLPPLLTLTVVVVVF